MKERVIEKWWEGDEEINSYRGRESQSFEGEISRQIE